MAGEGSRVPPQNIEAEKAVLGGMLIDNEAIHRVMEVLEPEDFYREAHRKIFEAVLSLYSRNEPSDLLTVSSALKHAGHLEQVGGASYLSEIVDQTPTSAHVGHYAKLIHEKSVLRRLIEGATDIITQGYEDGVSADDFLDEAEKIIFDVASRRVKKGFYLIKDVVKGSFKKIEELWEKKELITGTATGFKDLDKITSGLQSSDLIIVAGRPSSGKTAFALSIAENAACDHKVPCAIFSLEMSKEQLVQRLLCSRAQVDASKLRGGFLAESDWPNLTRAAGILSDAPIFIDDSPMLTVLEMRAKARRLKKEKDLGLVVVDYLQLIRSHGRVESREREISEISRSLKALAKEIHVPVIALSQLNRGLESRQDKRPMLSDLRESGCLAGDTLITNAQTGERIPIRQLAKRKKQVPFPVLGVDQHYRVEAYPMVKVFSSGIKKVFLLKTRSGRTIKASANHPFLHINGWKRLDELNEGEAIAIPRNTASLQPRAHLSEDELILLPHLLGDGCILPKQPYHYTSADWENIEAVRRSAKNLFGIEGRAVMQNNWWHLYLSSPFPLSRSKRHPITEWYKKLGIQPVRSWQKRLPEMLFQSSENDITLFLRHLWATDGNLSWKELKGRKKSGAVYYASSSKLLASQVQQLLLTLGIQSSISRIKSSKGYRDMYYVRVEGAEEQLKFCRQIGIAGKRRLLVPEMIEALEKIEQNKNTDVIPALVWKTAITEAKEEMGIGWREVSERIGVSYCGSTLLKHGISRSRMVRVAKALSNNEKLLDLAHSRIYWDKIHSITELGEEEVFDATVEGVHNFVANDIIVHNSIEQDADVVLMIYRDEMYNPESPDAGKAEIIIGKQRNGPTGKVTLAFLNKYTRFDNLARGSDEFMPDFGPDAMGAEEGEGDAPF